MEVLSRGVVPAPPWFLSDAQPASNAAPRKKATLFIIALLHVNFRAKSDLAREAFPPQFRPFNAIEVCSGRAGGAVFQSNAASTTIRIWLNHHRAFCRRSPFAGTRWCFFRAGTGNVISICLLLFIIPFIFPYNLAGGVCQKLSD